MDLWKKSGVWFTNSYPNITGSNSTIPSVPSNESIMNTERDYVSVLLGFWGALYAMDQIVRDEADGAEDGTRVGPNAYTLRHYLSGQSIQHLRSDSDNSVNRSLSLWQKLSDAALRLGDDTTGNSCQPSPQSSPLRSAAVSVIRNESQDMKENESERPIHANLWSTIATLEMKCLWDEFNELGTEMIVTKAGRVQFFLET
ncbi:unnamed protein product [Medioppia subpectinata]|uniref:T-box domain-containing protein n=1 Tax=Medioppia subpectinata TaxID=1979941 RepID=A0A7R9Q5T2_9ACAR|nr:unnamed protein product [Medioppia subpectinata]CAG2112592.1 unnamed protein product [Medioppia subpectinata]